MNTLQPQADREHADLTRAYIGLCAADLGCEQVIASLKELTGKVDSQLRLQARYCMERAAADCRSARMLVDALNAQERAMSAALGMPRRIDVVQR